MPHFIILTGGSRSSGIIAPVSLLRSFGTDRDILLLPFNSFLSWHCAVAVIFFSSERSFWMGGKVGDVGAIILSLCYCTLLKATFLSGVYYGRGTVLDEINQIPVFPLGKISILIVLVFFGGLPIYSIHSKIFHNILHPQKVPTSRLG